MPHVQTVLGHLSAIAIPATAETVLHAAVIIIIFFLRPLTIISDIDECTAGTDNCHDHATCKNDPGAFSCVCDSGYGGDGVTCSGKYYTFYFL